MICSNLDPNPIISGKLENPEFKLWNENLLGTSEVGIDINSYIRDTSQYTLITN